VEPVLNRSKKINWGNDLKIAPNRCIKNLTGFPIIPSIKSFLMILQSPVQTPILNRLGDMSGLDFIDAG
jgi:hypothetical protein